MIGFTAGIPKLSLNLTLLKSCDVCGVFVAPDPARNQAPVERLFGWMKEGKIRPTSRGALPWSRARGDRLAPPPRWRWAARR